MSDDFQWDERLTCVGPEKFKDLPINQLKTEDLDCSGIFIFFALNFVYQLIILLYPRE